MVSSPSPIVGELDAVKLVDVMLGDPPKAGPATDRGDGRHGSRSGDERP